DLQVIGVENGALVVASDDGTRFRLTIDDALQSKVRHSIPEPGEGRKLAPKDIQAHIRSGMSAQDVASITGAPLDYIQRFEGPVIAEREFVVKTALDVAVHTAADTDPLRQGKTFGTAIRERLHEIDGSNERWASWKDVSTGWIVKLSFTSNQIDHDARWQFDPKKHTLSPLNSEAITLSQQGEAAGVLMPRLRAVASEATLDSSRFDSGAFVSDESGFLEDAPAPAAISRVVVEDEPVQGNQTADLLEALRRRRGEREAAAFGDEDVRASHPSTGSIRLVDLPGDDALDSSRHTAPQPAGKKRGRAAMPSWDEIVFGARPDDLA
ncbi:MAG: septation protein SepH, partial [Rhodoglobus sp.]|nr:septation protein SepH [Rhodoglobus sp.]